MFVVPLLLAPIVRRASQVIAVIPCRCLESGILAPYRYFHSIVFVACISPLCKCLNPDRVKFAMFSRRNASGVSVDLLRDRREDVLEVDPNTNEEFPDSLHAPCRHA